MKNSFWRNLALVGLVLLPLGARSQEASTSAHTVAVKAGRLLDVRSGNYLQDQIILIQGDRIKTMGPSAQVQIPAGAKLIDLSNRTVLPGLIDCHTHLTMSPFLGAYRRLSMSVPREALLGARNARVTLEAGFTTVRSVAASGYADVALRDAINAGDVPGPRMLVSGPALSISGGHGDENLLAPEAHATGDGVADGVPAVMAKVRQNVKYGADGIKFMATGGVLSEA